MARIQQQPGFGKAVDPVESYYRGMFDRADQDGNGHIDALGLDFLLSCLGMPTDPTSMQLALAVMDENHDGTIIGRNSRPATTLSDRDRS